MIKKLLRWAYMHRWYPEGTLYHRGCWVVIIPGKHNPYTWKLRRVGNGVSNPNMPGEGDYTSEESAFKAGNREVKKWVKENGL